MRLLRSLSFRLAMIYVALFCASVAALLGIYYWMSVHAPLERAKEQVNAEAQALAQTYILDGAEVLTRQLEKRAVAPAHRKAFYAFIAGNGRVVTSNLPSWPQTIGSGWLRFEADTFHDGEEVDHEALVLDRRFDDGARLLIGRDIENIDDIEEHIQSAAAWMLGGAILIGLLGGMLMSNAIDKRIDAVNSAARRVISGDLSGRIATRGSGDDFDRLGETLNLMLERIETLLESVRRVSDSVAHELRTPLQRLLVTLEELETVDAPDRRTSLCAEAIQEAQRLRHIFDALLRIARIEGGRHSAGKHAFDLSELAEDAVDSYRPDADEKGIRLLADLTPAEVIGDPDLVFQALSNLIENALKYASAGAEILVRVGNDNGQRLIAVIDNGPGVAREDFAHLTERFYRAEGTSHMPGEGLGLSLVAAIANAHHAELRFRDNHPGLIVELAFPES